MVRGPPVGRKRRFIDRMLSYAENDSHGYSQKPPSGRWGPDFDCSSLVYQAAHDAGYSVGIGPDKVRFTGTMLKDFEKAGFQILPFANVGISDLKIGDILLNLALHAEVYVGNGESVGATGSETGGNGWGNNGFQNAIGYENLATSNEVQRGFDNQNSMSNQREILAAINGNSLQGMQNSNQNTQYITGQVMDKYNELERDIQGIAMAQQQTIANQAQCCCDIKQAIMAEGNATRAMLQQDKIESLQQRVNDLNLQAQMAGVVRYPMSTAYNAGFNPFCNCGNGMGCCA